MIPLARLRYTPRAPLIGAPPERRAPFGVSALKPSRSILLVLVLFAWPAAAEVEPALSAEFGSPLKLSANLGIRIGTPAGTDLEPGAGRGLLLQVQPGLGGVALNLGFTPVALPAWGTQAVGFAVKARILRSWGSPLAIEPRQTFAGAELDLAWIVKVSVGVLRRVQSGPGKATVFTWSVGVGL
jgi:hypothetical protein